MEESGGVNPEAEQQVPEQNKKNNSHSEMELVFVLILIGILGIGAFLYITFGSEIKSFVGIRQQFDISSMHVLTNEEMTSENYSDVYGRDKEALGLGIHGEKGRYYTHPESAMTLYVKTDGPCEGECLENWELYTAGGVDYYLYGNDFAPGNTYGENFDGVFQIARP